MYQIGHLLNNTIAPPHTHTHTHTHKPKSESGSCMRWDGRGGVGETTPVGGIMEWGGGCFVLTCTTNDAPPPPPPDPPPTYNRPRRHSQRSPAHSYDSPSNINTASLRQTTDSPPPTDVKQHLALMLKNPLWSLHKSYQFHIISFFTGVLDWCHVPKNQATIRQTLGALLSLVMAFFKRVPWRMLLSSAPLPLLLEGGRVEAPDPEGPGAGGGGAGGAPGAGGGGGGGARAGGAPGAGGGAGAGGAPGMVGEVGLLGGKSAGVELFEADLDFLFLQQWNPE